VRLSGRVGDGMEMIAYVYLGCVFRHFVGEITRWCWVMVEIGRVGEGGLGSKGHRDNNRDHQIALSC